MSVFKFGDDVNYMRPSHYRDPVVRKVPYNPVTVISPERVPDDVFSAPKTPRKIVKRMSFNRG